MNELPNTARVQIRHGGEVQHNSSNTAAQNGGDASLKFEVERDAQGSADAKDRGAERMFLSN